MEREIERERERERERYRDFKYLQTGDFDKKP
jgi:hypothetical protein